MSLCREKHDPPNPGCIHCYRLDLVPYPPHLNGGGKAPERPPCRSLGDDTGDRVECPSCRGSVRVKLLACSVFGVCTVGKRVETEEYSYACCVGCASYLPSGETP